MATSINSRWTLSLLFRGKITYAEQGRPLSTITLMVQHHFPVFFLLEMQNSAPRCHIQKIIDQINFAFHFIFSKSVSLFLLLLFIDATRIVKKAQTKYAQSKISDCCCFRLVFAFEIPFISCGHLSVGPATIFCVLLFTHRKTAIKIKQKNYCSHLAKFLWLQVNSKMVFIALLLFLSHLLLLRFRFLWIFSFRFAHPFVFYLPFFVIL